ncbi:MAG: hypothetical protein GY867_01370 [bacterium]|nr:hypothetical protein [bacterium]
MAKSKQRSASEGAALVAAFKKSGQTRRQFAEAKGVTVCSLQYWLSKTKQQAVEKSAVRFVEVVSKEANNQTGNGGVVMELASGIRICFDGLPSPSYLSSVAAAFVRTGGC